MLVTEDEMRIVLRTAFLVAPLLLVMTVGMAGERLSLMDAAKTGNLAEAKSLIAQKSDVNQADEEGATPLHWAVQRNDSKMVDLLIRSGAKVRATNRYGVASLELAAVNGNADVVTRLLDAGAEVDLIGPSGQTPLMSAARTGIVPAVKVLLAHGANVNARQKETGQTALMWAASENNVSTIEVLLGAGADFDAYTGDGAASPKPKTPVSLTATNPTRLAGLLSAYHSTAPRGDTSLEFTALHFAVRAGNIEAVRALVAAGADVNTPAVRRRSSGVSPLLLAVVNGHYELAAYLVDQGADVNDDAGFTALHQLARNRGPFIKRANVVPTGKMTSLELARRLMDAGADPNARMSSDFHDGYRNRINWLGATPFLVAAKNIDLDLIRLMLMYGADPKIATVDGFTPLMVAAGVGVWNPGEDFGTTPADEPRALDVAKLLVSLGNDPKGVAANGESPLHGAAYTGRNSMVQFLVDNGAPFEVKNLLGWTPLRIADGVQYDGFEKHQHHTAAFIRKLMADRGLQAPEFHTEIELNYGDTLNTNECEQLMIRGAGSNTKCKPTNPPQRSEPAKSTAK
jgi:ankyrin repeat protein